MKYLLLVTCLVMLAFPAKAQLFGEGYDGVRETAFRIGGEFNNIYVYNETPVNWDQNLGVLKAVSPDTTPGWNFRFSILDLAAPGNYRDSITFETDPTLNDSVRYFRNLHTGGYRIRMTKGTVDTFFYAWIFVNKLRAYLVKDENGYVRDFEHTCTSLDLRAIPKNDKRYPDSLRFYHEDFVYYDPNTELPYKLINFMNNLWVGTTGEPVESSRNSIRIDDPPAEHTTYNVTFKDTFGNSVTDRVIYRTINTKADFEIYINTAEFYQDSEKRLDPYIPDTSTVNFEKVQEGTDAKGEAPLHTMFVNKSKNGVEFEWILADSIFSPIDSGRYFTFDSLTKVFHIYRNPYKYNVRLVSKSPYGCIDSSEFKVVEIEASQMGDGAGNDAFPTAFSPDSEIKSHRKFYLKTNDEELRIKWKSIKSIRFWVYNQWGKEMYRYEGPMYTGWEGWDGYTNWGLKASQGVYYYVYEAEGWGKIKKTSAQNNENGTPATGVEEEGSHKILGKGYVFLLRQTQ